MTIEKMGRKNKMKQTPSAFRGGSMREQVVYYKVVPEPVFIRITEEESKLPPAELATLLCDRALAADCGQVWKDAAGYGHIQYEKTTEAEAKDHGYFMEEEE